MYPSCGNRRWEVEVWEISALKVRTCCWGLHTFQTQDLEEWSWTWRRSLAWRLVLIIPREAMQAAKGEMCSVVLPSCKAYKSQPGWHGTSSVVALVSWGFPTANSLDLRPAHSVGVIHDWNSKPSPLSMFGEVKDPRGETTTATFPRPG